MLDEVTIFLAILRHSRREVSPARPPPPGGACRPWIQFRTIDWTSNWDAPKIIRRETKTRDKGNIKRLMNLTTIGKIIISRCNYLKNKWFDKTIFHRENYRSPVVFLSGTILSRWNYRLLQCVINSVTKAEFIARILFSIRIYIPSKRIFTLELSTILK